MPAPLDTNQVNEKTSMPFSMIFTLIAGSFVLASLIVGTAWRQRESTNELEKVIVGVARDVAEVKVQVIEVRATLVDRVTVNEMEAWIRLSNALNPTHPLPGFRK